MDRTPTTSETLLRELSALPDSPRAEEFARLYEPVLRRYVAQSWMQCPHGVCGQGALPQVWGGKNHDNIHVILDNSSTHRTKEVMEWLAGHPNVHLYSVSLGGGLAE